MPSYRIPYVYEIQHIPSKRFYIGSRTTANKIDILDGYYTSSKVVKQLLKTGSISDFIIVGTIVCESKEAALKLEDFLLRSIPKEDRENYINIAFNVADGTLKLKSTKSIFNGKEYRYIGKNDEVPDGWVVQWKSKPPSRNGLRTYINPTTLETITCFENECPENFIYKVDWDNQLKAQKRKEIGVRNIWITNGEENTKIYPHEQPPDGWRFGKTIINKCVNRKPRRKDSGSTNGKIAITNGSDIKFVIPGTRIPDGWRVGAPPLGRLSPTVGNIFINDGIKNKLLPKDAPIPDGYVRGKLTYK